MLLWAPRVKYFLPIRNLHCLLCLVSLSLFLSRISVFVFVLYLWITTFPDCLLVWLVFRPEFKQQKSRPRKTQRCLRQNKNNKEDRKCHFVCCSATNELFLERGAKTSQAKRKLEKEHLALNQTLWVRTWKLLLMMKYLESSSAGEIKTCISNIRISLNFWESLKRNTLFVKHQQPFLFLIFCVKLLLSFLESDETNEIKLETRCFSSLRLTDYRRRAPISLL